MILILSRDIVSISLGTLSRDNILTFALEIMLKNFSYFILKKILFLFDLGKDAFHNLSIFKNNI